MWAILVVHGAHERAVVWLVGCRLWRLIWREDGGGRREEGGKVSGMFEVVVSYLGR